METVPDGRMADRGSYKGRHMGGQDTGTLRCIRNMRGPTWLDKLTNKELEG